MNRPFFYVANWKMYLSYKQTSDWLNEHHDDLANLAKNYQIIICPSFISLDQAAKLLNGKHILLGAQDCSEHSIGAYTGQISAQSLAEIGCNYCIIGHSEQRQYFDNTTIEAKALRLLEQQIVPILCVSNSTIKELYPAITVFDHFPDKELIIAYEPLKAIGTGNIPDNKHIEQIIQEIRLYIEEHKPGSIYYVLYGGSISIDNINRLKTIPVLDGFLIGRASIQFNDFKDIIES